MAIFSASCSFCFRFARRSGRISLILSGRLPRSRLLARKAELIQGIGFPADKDLWYRTEGNETSLGKPVIAPEVPCERNK